MFDTVVIHGEVAENYSAFAENSFSSYIPLARAAREALRCPLTRASAWQSIGVPTDTRRRAWPHRSDLVPMVVLHHPDVTRFERFAVLEKLRHCFMDRVLPIRVLYL